MGHPDGTFTEADPQPTLSANEDKLLMEKLIEFEKGFEGWEKFTIAALLDGTAHNDDPIWNL